MKVSIVTYDDLPDNERQAYGEGWRAECAGYLKIEHLDDTVEYFSDAMEPEDARFYRDLGWIPQVILNAFAEGRKSK